MFFGIGSKPSKRAEAAMPLAKCIWKKRYAETLTFADDIGKGRKAHVALEQLSSLEQSCPDKSSNGDVIAAILYNRQSAVGECLSKKAGPAYAAFRKAARKSDGSAATEFVQRGFPKSLKAAARACDVTLTYDFAQSERSDFGGRVLGW